MIWPPVGYQQKFNTEKPFKVYKIVCLPCLVQQWQLEYMLKNKI